MRKLILTYSFLAVISLIHPFPTRAADVIDVTANEPTPGENIPLGNIVVDTENGQKEIKIQPPSNASVGPNNEINFPDLKEFNDTVNSTFQFLLPNELVEKVRLPQTSQKLKGVVFNPGCKFPTGDKPTEARGEQTFEAPDYWTTLLGSTRISQSVSVPGKPSDVELTLPQNLPPLPNEAQGNKEVENCPEITGEGGDTITVKSEGGPTQVFFTWLSDFLNGIINGIINPPQQTPTVIKPQKYLQGEAAFAKQTSEDMGFLRSFCPEDLCTENTTSYEKTDYQVGNTTRDVRLGFRGIAGARDGYDNLKASLYPADLQTLTVYQPGIGLTYNIPYRDISFSIPESTKERIIQNVLKYRPRSRIQELLDHVVEVSINNSINPAFSLAIWIEESGASDRKIEEEQIQRMKEGKPYGFSPFGCFPRGNTQQIVSFENSINCFVNFTVKEHPSDFADWARSFCGPNVEPICANNPHFLQNLKNWYDEFTK